MKWITPTLAVATWSSSANAARVSADDLNGIMNQASLRSLTKRAKAGNIAVLQYNLGWESMSGIDFGSGKIASKHCVPGQVDVVNGQWTKLDDDVAAIVRKMPFKRSKEEKERILLERVMDKYMTSCSLNMLNDIADWGGGNQYQLATFVELCSPGVNDDLTSSWGGFQESSEDVNGYNSRQCGLETFRVLQQYFPEHKFVINNQPGKFGPVHQLTAYSPGTFGEVQHALKTQFTPGRPLTALFLSRSQDDQTKTTLVLNVHSIHFRKTLINPKNSDAELKEPGTYSEMVHFALEVAGADTSIYSDAKGHEVFGIASFGTKKLQDLFGSFIENQIAAALVDDSSADCSNKADCKSYAQQLLQGDGNHIIMSGDFNDETGELAGPISLLGKTVSLDLDKRVRTCCSDRDPKWLAAYKNDDADAIGYDTEPSYPTHAQKNFEYFLEQNKYMGSCTTADEACIDTYVNALGQERAVLPGKEKGAPTENEGEYSKYPIAADLILTTGIVTQFGFPSTFVQSFGDGTISDHDPVAATLKLP